MKHQSWTIVVALRDVAAGKRCVVDGVSYNRRKHEPLPTGKVAVRAVGARGKLGPVVWLEGGAVARIAATAAAAPLALFAVAAPINRRGLEFRREVAGRMARVQRQAAMPQPLPVLPVGRIKSPWPAAPVREDLVAMVA